MSIEKLAVVGGGAWGTALAQVAATGGRDTLLWALEDDVVSAVNRIHENPLYLKGLKLEKSLRATSNFSDLADADAWLVVTPAQHMRAVLRRSPCPNMPLILCSKGIEETSGKLLHEVAHEVCPSSPVAVLSGPTFAHEVAAGLPTAVTLACEDRELGEQLRGRINLPHFRTYCTDDVAGAEVGGAVKNVLAIACGISEGKGFGDSARAALTTRGFSEMLRFGEAIGARRSTLTGLSGLGDLILTCSSRQSRNFSFGLALGRNGSTPSRPSQSGGTIEGVPTAKAIAALAAKRSIDLPVCEAVNAILNCRITVDEAIGRLLARPLRAE